MLFGPILTVLAALGVIVLFLLFSSIFRPANGDFGTPFSLSVGAIILWGYRRWLLRDYNKTVEEFNSKLNAYNENYKAYNSHLEYHKNEYQKQLAEYEKKVELLKNPFDVRKHRINELQKSLSKNYIQFSNKKAFAPLYSGATEDRFYSVLNSKFSGNIYRNYGFELGSTTYLPDFVYYDYKGVLIDIEIDEPYEQNSGKPIHYRGADDYRDRTFNNENFIVIRFAEEQIKRYADQCCSYIEKVRQAILDCEPIESINSISIVPKVMQWSKEDAESMARRNYRNTY